jgi:outer membrane receptor protein involved in Fe transport
VTAGLAIDEIDGTQMSKDAVNSKLGVMWQPARRTTVRVAAFEALLGSLTTSMQNTQPRLEPVQLAGFSQLLLGNAADSLFGRGFSIVHELSSRLFLGWQADLREIDRVVVALGPGPTATSEVELSERVQTAYLFWAPHDRLSISARYEHGRYRNANEVFGYRQMTTERLPLEIRYFGRRGLTAGARISAVEQDGLFATPSPPPSLLPALAPGQDRFSILDAFIGYRLPNRRGLLSLNADNLLDRRFQFQDIDPMNPSLIPERLVSFRFTLAFD